jgi:hypothetical protein
MTETLVAEPDPNRKICAVCRAELEQGRKCPDHNQFGVPAASFDEAVATLGSHGHRKRLPEPTTHVMKQDPQTF